MQKKTTDSKQRRVYQKPVLRSFPLVAEEVMNLNCKTTVSAPGSSGMCAMGIACIDSGNLGS